MFGEGAGGMPLEELLKQFGGFGGQRGHTHSPFGRGGPRPTPPESEPAELREEITVPFRTAVVGGQHQIQLLRRGGKSESITMRIPAGIADGKTLRLRGQGDQLPDGRQGDLLVKIRVAPHPNYTRRGANLHVVVPISLQEAVAGAKIDLPTPHGTLAVSVPPNSSSGRLLRLKGMGIRGKDHSAGDLIAELQIVLPESLSSEQAESLRRLADQLGDYNPRKKLQW